MAEILALGISHYPPLHGHDDRMAWILKRMLQNPKLPQELRFFMYLPFEHAESIADQERCVLLVHASAPLALPYALEHERIIRRFGRFPHRNPILGRHTTPAEQAFLDGGGFAG